MIKFILSTEHENEPNCPFLTRHKLFRNNAIGGQIRKLIDGILLWWQRLHHSFHQSVLTSAAGLTLVLVPERHGSLQGLAEGHARLTQINLREKENAVSYYRAISLLLEWLLLAWLLLWLLL